MFWNITYPTNTNMLILMHNIIFFFYPFRNEHELNSQDNSRRMENFLENGVLVIVDYNKAPIEWYISQC